MKMICTDRKTTQIISNNGCLWERWLDSEKSGERWSFDFIFSWLFKNFTMNIYCLLTFNKPKEKSTY